MSTLDEVKSWLAEQLPALIEKYDVPGAAVAVLAGGEVVDDAAGVLNKATGVEATRRLGLPDRLDHQALDEHAGHAARRRGQGRPRRAGPHLPARVPDRRRGGGRADHHAPAAQPHRPASRATSSPTPASATTASRSTSACCTRCPSCSRSGEQFSYNNAGYCVLGRLVEVLREKPYDECLREHLFAPLGLTHAATEPVRGDHVPGRDGPHRARARHRLPARAGLGAGPLQRPGRLDARDAPARPADVRRDAPRTTARPPTAPRCSRPAPPAGCTTARSTCPTSALMGDSWGLGFELFDTPDGAIIGHDGSTIGQNAFLRMVPEAGVAVALLTNGGDVLSLYHDIVGPRPRRARRRHASRPLPTPPADAASASTRAGTSAPTPPRSPTWSSARTRTAGSGSSRPPRALRRARREARAHASSSTSAATA